MDTKKFLLIVSVTVIFIILFCGKIIEGVVNEEVEDNTFPPVMEEITPTYEPIDDTMVDAEDFGIDCVNNCEVFYHECEVKEEVETVNGKSKRVKTYNNIENCPNGKIPDQKCSDDGWSCRVCKRGYYVDHDGLCKPLPSTGFIILIVLLVIIVCGIISFGGLKIKEFWSTCK